MSTELASVKALKNAVLGFNPRKERYDGSFSLSLRSKPIKGLLPGGVGLSENAGQENGREFLELSDFSPIGPSNLKRTVKFYYDLEAPKKLPDHIIGLKLISESDQGFGEINVDKHELSGIFNARDGSHSAWSLNIDDSGRIIDQNFSVNGKQTKNLSKLTKKEIASLKKIGFGPQLVTIAAVLQKNDLQSSRDSKTSERLKALAKTDMGVVAAASIGVLSLFLDKNPALVSSMIGLSLYSIFYFFNQMNVIKKGLAVPFDEQKKLANQSNDLSLMVANYFSWLTQATLK
ncbi:hypothetical protein M1328_00180 [Patescibacteria group bacterium]|nr:hypothetical protein [Patescibacteria group bacterium]